MGSGRDGKATGFKAPSVWPSEITEVWRLKTGTGDASPVVSRNRLFIFSREGDEEVIRCLDTQNGKELWKYSYGALAVTGPAQSHPGPRSTPLVIANRLITFGVGGTLSCFDTNSGKLLWKFENPDLGFPQFFTGMSPIVVDNLCIIHLGTRDKGQLTAFDINNGSIVWRSSGEGPAYGSPMLLEIEGVKMVVLLTEKSLAGFAVKDGKTMWQHPTVVVNRFYNAASPVIAGNTIYFTGQGSGTHAIRVKHQAGVWSAEEIWSNSEAGTKWNTPVLKDGYLYGLSDQRRLFCINAGNGKTEWIDQTNNHDFGTVVDAGTVMIALPASSNLIFYRPTANAYSESARYKVSDTPVFTFPVIFGQMIYIKDAEHLICFTLKQ